MAKKSMIFDSPLGYSIDPEMYYESHTVGKGRTDKDCVYCGKVIPKGQKHTVHKFYGDGGDWPTHPTHDMHQDHGDSLGPNEKSCTDLFNEEMCK